jgi:CheY-like chemotaxis protein
MSLPPRWLIVIEHDRLDLHERLARAFDEGVEVVLDRRRADRRRDDPSQESKPEPAERRRRRRRQSLPAAESAFAQNAGFFVVAEGAAGPQGADLSPDASDVPQAPGVWEEGMRPAWLETAQEASGQPRVLVCDDDALVRDSVVEALTGEFSVETAHRAVETIQNIMRTRYDALILDLRLPGLGGLEAVPVIKRLDARLPIIVITGYSSYEAEQAVRGTGIFYYLPKPFSIDELSDAVRAAVRVRDREGRLRGDPR